MPPKKAKKPIAKKKPVAKKPQQQQKQQQQQQQQRIVVNVNQQSKRKAAARRRAPARQQMQLPVQQQIVLTGGSAPLPLAFNPAPVQSTPGFNAPPPRESLGTPMNLNEPVALPTFAEEPVRVIGDENVSVPVPAPAPVSTPEPIVVPSPRPPVSMPDSRFISQPPPSPPQSISSLFSDISKETGITSKSVADFLFKKKKTEPKAPPPSVASQEPQMLSLMNPNPSVGSSAFPSTASSSSSAMSVPTSIATDGTKADYLFLDDRSIPEDMSISSMSGFNLPSDKSSIKAKPIIAEPKEVVVLKKPELKRSSPFDPFGVFSDNESVARGVPEMSDFASDVATQGTKPPKKRPVVAESSGSERELNIIPQDVAGRRMPPIKEKKSNYQSKADLQLIAKDKKINLFRPDGKAKTMNELRLEINA